MTEDPTTYGTPKCPRCNDRHPAIFRCMPSQSVKGCESPAGVNEHSICARCGFEWISAGEIPPVMRTPTQLAISIGAAFEEIVGIRGRR